MDDGIFDAFGATLAAPSQHSVDEAHRAQLRERLLTQYSPTAYVSGTGSFVPCEAVSNAEFATAHQLRFPGHEGDVPSAFDEMVYEKTGIRSRRHAFDRISLSEIAARAASAAIADAKLSIEDVSHVVLGATWLGADEAQIAGELRTALQKEDLVVEIIPFACASAGFCLNRAVQLLATTSEATHVVAIGADKGSSFIDFADVGTAILFGDGAAAMVVSRRGSQSVGSSAILRITTGSYPQFGEYIFLNPSGKIQMPNGKGVFREACNAIKTSTQALLDEASITGTEVDRFILHQANTKLPAFIARSLNLPPEKVPTNIRFRGNTCAASPLILASEAAQQHLLRKGDLVVLGAVGLGMKSSAALLIW